MISVLLPFRNAEKTLQSCLATISNQTLDQFEILAVNDHSTDNSRDIVAAWPDPRIRLMDNPGRGLVAGLNFGIEQAQYPLIARMDADDLMRSNRLAAQYVMFSDQPNLGLVGSRVRLFPASRVLAGYREYIRWQNSLLDHQDLYLQRFVESPLAHPSVMFRKQVVVDAGGYRQGDFAEDYELWLRLFDQHCQMAKHPDVLLDWRESDRRLSRVDPAYARTAFDRLRAEYLEKLPVLGQRPVAFWGAGRKTRLRARHLINKGITPYRWIDIDPKKIGNKLNGVTIEAPVFLGATASQKPFVLVYVTNHGARDLIVEELVGYGYQQGGDFLAVG